MINREEKNMEICIKCNRNFKNKYSLSNHKRFGCFSLRTLPKQCPNFDNNVNCKGTYIYSTSKLCKSCIAKKSSNTKGTSGKTYEEIFGAEKAQKLKENISFKQKEFHKNNPQFNSGSNNHNYGKTPWMKGCTWEQIHGEDKALRLKKEQSIRSAELSKTLTGRQTLDKLIAAAKSEKNRISVYKKVVRKYGKEYADAWYINYSKERNTRISNLGRLRKGKYGLESECVKNLLKTRNITYEEYLEDMNDLDLYRKNAYFISRNQPIHLLENYGKRGLAGVKGAYHLDHIISINYGYKNNIPAEIIGSLYNLQFIPWKENIIKGSKSDFIRYTENVNNILKMNKNV